MNRFCTQCSAPTDFRDHKGTCDYCGISYPREWFEPKYSIRPIGFEKWDDYMRDREAIEGRKENNDV